MSGTIKTLAGTASKAKNFISGLTGGTKKATKPLSTGTGEVKKQSKMAVDKAKKAKEKIHNAPTPLIKKEWGKRGSVAPTHNPFGF